MNIKINLSFTPDHARELLELVERASDSPFALPVDKLLAYHIKTQLIDAGVVPEDTFDNIASFDDSGYFTAKAQTNGAVTRWPWDTALTKASQYLPLEGDSLHTGD